MEGPQPNENPDNEYMAMDPDQWEDQDDTYENGDTLDIGQRQVVPVSGGASQLTNRGSQQTNDTLNRPAINSVAHPSRYMTLRWPPENGSIRSAKTEQLVFFQRTMVGLVLLCLLLLAVVLGLSIACDILAEKTHFLLKEQLLELGQQCGTTYHISDKENQTSAQQLYVFNCETFKKYMIQESFVLYLKNDSCKTWKCKC